MADEIKDIPQEAAGEAPTSAPAPVTPPEAVKMKDTPTPLFIKKRNRRRAALAVFAFASVGVIAMAIIAFLGQNFGTFTIKVQPSLRASLSMSEMLNDDGDNLSGETSYLDLSGTNATSLTDADMLPEADYLDADLHEMDYDAKKQAAYERASTLSNGFVNFLSFTFYIRNMSDGPVEYRLKLASTTISEPSNVNVSCTVESLVHVRVYENTYYNGSRYYRGADALHEQTTYALPRTGTVNEPELISVGELAEREENRGYCTNFESSDPGKGFTVFTGERTVPRFTIMRYTVVAWLEGNDIDSERRADGSRTQQPEGGSVTLGMTFTGINAEEENS